MVAGQSQFNTLPHAGAWLEVLPLPYAKLTMEGEAYRRLLRRRLGLAQSHFESKCRDCGHLADRMGAHYTWCSVTIPKHKAGVTALLELARQAGMAVRAEVNTTAKATDRARPADLLFQEHSHGRDLAVDFAVATALLSHPETLKDPSYAMNKIIATKRAKYLRSLGGSGKPSRLCPGLLWRIPLLSKLPRQENCWPSGSRQEHQQGGGGVANLPAGGRGRG